MTTLCAACGSVVRLHAARVFDYFVVIEIALMDNQAQITETISRLQGRNQVYGIRDHSPGIGIIDPGSRVTSHGIRISHFLCVSLRDQGSQ